MTARRAIRHKLLKNSHVPMYVCMYVVSYQAAQLTGMIKQAGVIMINDEMLKTRSQISQIEVLRSL